MPVVQMIDTPLSESAFASLGEHARSVFGGAGASLPADVAEALADDLGPVYVGARAAGKLVGEAWVVDGSDTASRLVHALSQAAKQADDAGGGVTTLEIALCHTPRDVDLADDDARRWLYSNVWRGTLAIEVEVMRQKHWFSPFSIVAMNRRHRKLLEDLKGELEVSDSRWAKARIRGWRTHEIVVPIQRSGPAVPRFRSAAVVDPKSITRQSVHDFAIVLSDYLFSHVNEEGHLTYFLDPAFGEDVDRTDNNMIRQWMATCAMNRSAAYRNKDRELYAIVDRNIRFNLRNYYRAQGSIGLIQFDHHINLGSVALAAQGLMEHPNRASFARAERKLLNAVQWCWDKGNGTGQFATVIHPLNMNHGNNFYPGEAMLTWSMVYRETKDAKLLEQFMRSFLWYKQWHLEPENRKPAFVPWHVQANFNMWELTGDQRLVDFTFEMSDWLLSVQRKQAVTPDGAGQFYDPRRPHFGTPHASSTGVYMEGYIDAYEMAKRLGDERRKELYREALIRGIRNCMQLTYKDDMESFYGFDPARLIGGTRTAIYNNRVRCDNVQHNLMAILKVLTRFEDDEFEHPDGPLTFDGPV